MSQPWTDKITFKGTDAQKKEYNTLMRFINEWSNRPSFSESLARSMVLKLSCKHLRERCQILEEQSLECDRELEVLRREELGENQD